MGNKTTVVRTKRNPIKHTHAHSLKELLEDTLDTENSPDEIVKKLAALAGELNLSPQQWNKCSVSTSET